MQTEAITLVGARPVPAVTLNARRFRELVERFLDGGADVSDATKRLYRFGLMRFARWIEENGIENPLREDIVRFKEDQVASGITPGSVNAVLTAIRTFFAWTDASRIYHDMAATIKGCRRTSGHKRDAWTSDQINAALAAIPADTLIGLRDRAILTLLVRTGRRTIELCRADVGDIRNKDGQVVMFYQGKGHQEKDACRPLTEDVLVPLREYLQARGETDLDAPLFCSESDRNHCSRLTTRTLRAIVKERFRAVGVDDPRLSAHSCRHFAASNALKHGASLIAVQQMLGHSAITTTQIYLHDIESMGADAAERFISL